MPQELLVAISERIRRLGPSLLLRHRCLARWDATLMIRVPHRLTLHGTGPESFPSGGAGFIVPSRS